MKKINVGVIGLGIGKAHVESFRAHPHCNVKMACDFDHAVVQNLRERYPDLVMVSAADEILTDPSIDVVSICSYDNYHFEQIMTALQNNKHVFVEKPLCLYPRELIDIKKQLQRNKRLRLSSNFVLRTCPRFIELKEKITKGDMGTIYAVQADYLWGRPNKLTEGWRKDMPFYSIVYGAAVHMIDLIMWMLEMKPYEVCGSGNKIATQGTSLRFNDFAAITLKFKNGLVAHISAHGGCVHPHFHALRLYGIKETFIQNFKEGLLFSSSDPDDQPRSNKDGYPAKGERFGIIQSFIDSILVDNRKAIVAEESAFDVMSVCFAAEEAIQKNKLVRIKYI